ncbi:ribonuclease T2 family protein [Aureimonas populi]|uniref:Ribonuclease n=1 Tax=Aureimonas populi TaxID=1701758 RepID=A0ABW5CN14_9HYPH|nr:ribonuclease [Aureimonas populi]
MKPLLIALFLLLPHAALAQVPMVGAFTAEATCAATPSIREPDRNPGNIATQAGRTYELIGRNAVPGSHYLILIPEAEPERRWVAYGCGRVEEDGSTGPVQASAREREPALPAKTRHDDYVLAVSWQPAFCETRRRVSECRGGGRDDGGFTLHGLWPQPRGRQYCGVPARIVAVDEEGDWRNLPQVEISPRVRAELAAAMPGVASSLDRHQWWKHGTCFDGEAEDYFALSVRLLSELNESAVRELFEAAIGSELSAREIRAVFDRAFGRGAGERVLVDCAEIDGRRLVRELRIALAGRPGEALAAMIRAGEPAARGCRGGEVDPGGFERG